jgi:hypothetical protein
MVYLVGALLGFQLVHRWIVGIYKSLVIHSCDDGRLIRDVIRIKIIGIVIIRITIRRMVGTVISVITIHKGVVVAVNKKKAWTISQVASIHALDVVNHFLGNRETCPTGSDDNAARGKTKK